MKRDAYFSFQGRQFFVQYGFAWRLVRGGWLFWRRDRRPIAGSERHEDSYRLYVGPFAIEAFVLPLPRLGRAG